jgi:hypothetical protein
LTDLNASDGISGETATRRSFCFSRGISKTVRYWQIADMPLAATNVGFGGKTDITVDGPECPLMTQSGHVLRANDDHLASSLVIFSFLIAAPLVFFFLPVADNFVDFLALLACCTYCVGASTLRAMKRFTRSVHSAIN